MFRLVLIQCLVLCVFSQSLKNILQATDDLFKKFGDGTEFNIEEIESLLKRTYGLYPDKHVIKKRSLEDKTTLIRDEEGVYFALEKIRKAGVVPSRFPNDIALAGLNNQLFAVSLQRGKDRLAKHSNELLIFKYIKGVGFTVHASFPVFGASRLSIQNVDDSIFIAAMEYNEKNSQTFQGTELYKMTVSKDQFVVRKVQTIDVFHQQAVEFWEYLDQLYLIIAAEHPSDNSSNILIFKWLGLHFDEIQKIPTDYIESITPFTIGSFMYLAVANHKDSRGNTDIHSWIYRFHLQDNMFKLFQKIPTQGAKDVKYFKFKDPKSSAEEHFLIYANYFSLNEDKTRNYETDSIVYKYVNDYFVPFQSFKLYGVRQWVPIMGENNEFLLLGLCTYGIVGFQYDGWRFVEVPQLPLPESNLEREIESMRAFSFARNLFVAVADKNNDGTESNVWQATFTKKNDLEDQYREIESWCDKLNVELPKHDVEVALDPLKKIVDFTSGSLNFKVPVHFHDLEVEVLQTDKFGNMGPDLIEEINGLESDLENLKSSLSEMREMLNTVENGTDYQDVEGPVYLPEVKINCKGPKSCVFPDLRIKKLNGEDWDVFSKSLVPLDQDLELGSVEFENISVEDFTAHYLNNHPVEALIDVNSDHLLNAPLIVNGTVVVHGELKLTGFLDGIVVDEKNVLLKRFDQNFTDKFIFSSAVIENLELSGKLNGHELEDLMKAPEVDLGDTFTNLNVHKLYVEGLISGYNVSSLENALKCSGDQELKGDIFISNLTVDDVDLPSNFLSGKNLSELIQITKNENYTLKGDLIFHQDELKVNNLITDQIHSVPVSEFPGQGRSASEEDASSPKTVVFDSLTVKDIRSIRGNFSLLDIYKNGLRLDEPIIESEFEFSDLEVKDLIAEKINDRPVHSWVFNNNSTEPVVITGEKIFKSDVTILEKSYVYLVDGVDVEELEKDALKLSGDQNITKNLVFESIKCDNLNPGSIRFRGKNLEDVIKSPERIVINGSMTVDELDAENLVVSGKIDGVSWDDLQADSIFKNRNPDALIPSEKVLNGRLKVKNLNLVDGSVNEFDVLEFFKSKSGNVTKIVIPHDVVLNDTLIADRLIFEDELGPIKSEDFGKEWLLSEGDQNITGPMIFENVKLNSGCSLKNKIVNKVNVTSLFEDSLKIDEDANIKSLQVMTEIETTDVNIQGTVNGAKFSESVILARSDKPQVVEGDWIFNHNLTINGSLRVEEFISGLNVSHLCSLKLDDEEINLIVGGSVKFPSEPEILETVNGVNVTRVLDQIWLKSGKTVLTGKAKFQDLELHDKIHLKGSLNNVNLTDLAKNYFNKNSTRVIPASMEFENILITDTVKITNMTVGGKINGIDIKKLHENILLMDEDQVITGKIRFNKFHAENLELNDTVNGLDLNKDVLRYDVENAVVKGEKKFESLKVQDLTMSPGKSLQGVVVSDWRKNAAKIRDNVTIVGDVTFSRIKAPKLNVKGNVNDVKFDTKHILTTNGNQVITGKKYFDLQKYPNETLKMKSLNVSGLIGGIDLKNLIDNQAYKNRDLTFTKPVNFTEGIKADRLSVKGLFQGFNMTEILDGISNPTDLDKIDDKFGHLLNESRRIEYLMSDQPYFLDHFELVQTVKSDVVSLVPFSFDTDGKLSLCAFRNNSETEILKWDSFSETFIPQDMEMKLNMTYVSPEIRSNKFYLYIETNNKTLLLDHGKMIEIQTNNTACITSFEIKQLNKSCLFVGRKLGNSKILCNSTLMDDLQTYQELETLGSVGVSALNIDKDVFIAAINKEKINDKTENILWVYEYNRKYHHFQKLQSLPEINPVAVSTISHENYHFLVSAGGHLPGSVRSSALTIFRFDPIERRFARYHSIVVDTPIDVRFAVLPSSELVLYVLTANPAKPLVVFSHQGIRGFVKETSGLSLYRGSNLYPVTDQHGEHFLVISGYNNGRRAQILKASFKGTKN